MPSSLTRSYELSSSNPNRVPNKRSLQGILGIVAEYPNVTMNAGPSNGEPLGDNDDFVTGSNRSDDCADLFLSW